MGKTDEKGEPVQTVTIGGKKVDVPIIFILPEESGEKEIERYQHPKVHIESKKVAPLLGAGIGVAAGAAGGVAGAAGKKIGEDVKDTVESAPQALSEGAKLSETLSAESEEQPLDELTHGKLEEIEKLPYKDQLQGTVMDETRAVEAGKVRPKQNRHLIDPKWKAKKKKKKLKELNDEFFDETIARVGAVKGGFQLNYDDFGEEFEAAKKKKKKVEKGEDEEDNSKRFTIDMLRAIADGKIRPPWDKNIRETSFMGKGYSDEFKEGGFAQESFEEAPKKKKKKKKEPLLSNSWEAMRSEWFPERKSKGYGDDDDEERWGRRPRDRDPDEDVGQHEGRHRGHKPDKHEEYGTVGMGHAAYPTRRKILPPKDYDEHTLEEKEDIEMAKRGEAALPMVGSRINTRTGRTEYAYGYYIRRECREIQIIMEIMVTKTTMVFR